MSSCTIVQHQIYLFAQSHLPLMHMTGVTKTAERLLVALRCVDAHPAQPLRYLRVIKDRGIKIDFSQVPLFFGLSKPLWQDPA